MLLFTCFGSYAGKHTAHERVIDSVPTVTWLDARYGNRTDSMTADGIADVAAVPHLPVAICCDIEKKRKYYALPASI